MNVLIEFKREVILIRISRCLCLNHSRFKKEENTLLNLYGVLMKINYDLKKYIFLLFPISSSSSSSSSSSKWGTCYESVYSKHRKSFSELQGTCGQCNVFRGHRHDLAICDLNN